jgi:non-heme chloroperoxidase
MKITKLIVVLFLTFLLSLVVSASGRTPKDGWAKFDQNKIHYYDVGGKSKNALILIHGWACNADFWKESINAFPGYRVIAIDLPGHGQSDKPKTNYSMEYFARSIEAVMKQAKVKKAVLAGHSMGTPVIRQFYRLYPEQTLGLIVVDGALQPLGPKAEVEKFFQPLFANYNEEAPKFIDGLLGPTREDLRADIKTTMLAVPDYVGVSAMKAMLDDAIWIDDKISVPVLAIMAASPNWPADIKDRYKTVAPKLEFQMWSGVSHFLMMEKPKEFNEQVKTFIGSNKLL